MGADALLCVEPDPESQAFLREVLCEFEPVFATDAFDALRALNSSLFDAYVLESWLPDFSGLALCREIHRTDPCGPVVLCTDAAREQDRLLALRAGANAYMCKPFDPAELLRELRVLLELARVGSSRAALAARAVIGDEFARHSREISARVGAARNAAIRAVERICSAKAFTAYAAQGGTRANFERCWDTLFGDIAASYGRYSGPSNGAATRVERSEPAAHHGVN